ncbi:hypothetical protein CsSME_00045761 [Camellia sinensis var. sinensis]
MYISSWNDHPGKGRFKDKKVDQNWHQIIILTVVAQLRKIYNSYSGGTTEEDLFSCELWSSSSRRDTGTLINKLLAEEMSKETESKRRPPSVIANLMGLDGPSPQQPLHRQFKGFSKTYR